MKISKARTLIVVLCIAALIITAGTTAFLAISGNNSSFSSENTAADLPSDKIVANAAADGDMWGTGFPDGTIYGYTVYDWGVSMSKGEKAADGKTLLHETDMDSVKVVKSGNTLGTKYNPRVINTTKDWEDFVGYINGKTTGDNAYGKNEYFVLNSDLDFTDAATGKQGAIKMMTYFAGTLYGNSHKIINPKFVNSSTSDYYIGIVKQPLTGCYISDLAIQNYYMQLIGDAANGVWAGPIAGMCYGSTTGITVANCVTTGEATITMTGSQGWYMTYGGIIGGARNGGKFYIYKCSASYKLTANRINGTQGWLMRGGIVGIMDDYQSSYTSTGHIYDCFSSLVGTLTGSLNGVLSGGVIGFIRRPFSTILKNCVSIQNTNDPSYSHNGLGSLFSQGESSIGKTYTISNVFCWSQSIVGGKNFAAPMMGRYENTLTASASVAYNYSQLGAPANNNMTGCTNAASYTDLWTQFNNNIDSNNLIWIKKNVTDITATIDSNGYPAIDLFETPVHITKAKVTFCKSDDTDWDFGKDESGEQKPNVIEYELTEDGRTALPTPEEPDTDHKFIGWTMDKTKADSKTYKIYSRDILGNVKMYPVWSIPDFEASITITSPDETKFPVTGTSITTTYSNDRNNYVTLTANTDSKVTHGNKTYKWYKDGVQVANQTKQTLTLKNVKDSGRYTVKVNAASSDDLLWRGEDESEPVDVTINKGTIILQDGSFKLDSEAYIGQNCDNTVVYRATAVDAATGTSVAGKFNSWSNQLPIALPEGKTEYTNNICFYPDASVIDNYVVDINNRVNLEVTFTPSQIYILFNLYTISVELKMPILYNRVTSAEEIRAGFSEQFTEYYEGLPDGDSIKASLATLAPKLDNVFIDEYNTDLPAQKKTYPIQVSFESREFTFTFDPMGGKLAAGMDKTHNFFYNDLTKGYLKNPIHDPSKPNDRFQYWYYEVDNGGTIEEVEWRPALDRVTRALTLKAKWRTVILTLQSIEAEMAPGVTLTALTKIKDGDLIVTAHYLDDQNQPYDEVLEFGDYSANIVYNNPSDGQLHVGSEITISYKYGAITKDVTMSPTTAKPLIVNPIDLKTEEYDIYLDPSTGNRKVVMKADGTAKHLNVKNMIPNEHTYFIDVNNIKYTYTGLASGTVTEPVDKDIYTVKIEFPVRSDDYVAHDVYVTLELKELTTVFVEWQGVAPYVYQYNGKPQHPIAILRDADGVEILARDWKYTAPDGDDWTSVKKGHSVIVELVNTDAYEFDAGTSKAALFEIAKASLAAPTVDGIIEYTGANINIADHLEGFDPDLMDISGDVSKLNVGTYYAVVTIKDSVKANAAWTSGKSSETVEWKISKRALTVIWDRTEFYIDNITDAGINPKVIGFVGMASDDLSHFDYDNFLIYEGDVAMTEVGTYSIKVKLNNLEYSKNYELKEGVSRDYFILSDESMVGVTVTWKDVPAGGYKFNGEIQGPTLENVSVQLADGTDITQFLIDNDHITLGGDVATSKWAQTKSYKAIITIDEASGYYIKSGAEKQYKIIKNDKGEGDEPKITQINKPTLKDDEQQYSGSDITFELNGFDADKMTMKGELVKKNAGKYSVTISIKDKNKYAWADGSNGDITLEFEITKKALKKPTFENKKQTFTGSELEFVLEGFDEDTMDMDGDDLFQIEIGKYSVTISLKDKNNFAWEGGSSDDFELKFEIAKKTVSGGNIGEEGGNSGIPENFPLWQVITGSASLALSILFACLWANNDKKRKKAEKDTARARGLAAAAVLPVFSTVEVLGSLSNMACSIIAFCLMAFMLFMFVMMLVSKSKLSKAEAACEQALIEKQRQDKEAEKEERRQRDEEMKMMFMGMMNSQASAQQAAPQPVGISVADTKQLVGEVIQALLPAMQAMLPPVQQGIQYIPYQESLPEAAFSSDDEEDEMDMDEEWDTEDDEQDEVYEAELMDDSVEPEEAHEVPKRMPSNFRARLKVSSDKNRTTYAIIKNEFCAQKSVSYRACGRVEKIKFHGDLIAVIGVAKRSIKLWLALDPNEFDRDRYFHKDVSDKPRYEKVPMYLRVGSERAQKRVIELLEKLFEKFGIERRHKYEEKPIQELIFTLKGNKLLKDKENKHLLCESVHVHDADKLENETAENSIEIKDIAPIAEEHFESVSLDVIDENFLDGQRVTLEKLKKKGLVSENCNGIRIEAGSRLSKPLIIFANEYSLSAVKMIVLTGGRAVQLVQF